MVSHGSHTNHEFLILVIRVPNVSLAVESFVTCEKVLIMMLRNLPTFKMLVSFYSLVWQIYYKLNYEKFCKK